MVSEKRSSTFDVSTVSLTFIFGSWCTCQVGVQFKVYLSFRNKKNYISYNMMKGSLGVTGNAADMWPEDHRFKPWKQPLAKMQVKVVYNKPLWSGTSLNPAHNGSLMHQGCPYTMVHGSLKPSTTLMMFIQVSLEFSISRFTICCNMEISS